MYERGSRKFGCILGSVGCNGGVEGSVTCLRGGRSSGIVPRTPFLINAGTRTSEVGGAFLNGLSGGARGIFRTTISNRLASTSVGGVTFTERSLVLGVNTGIVVAIGSLSKGCIGKAVNVVRGVIRGKRFRRSCLIVGASGNGAIDLCECGGSVRGRIVRRSRRRGSNQGVIGRGVIHGGMNSFSRFPMGLT